MQMLLSSSTMGTVGFRNGVWLAHCNRMLTALSVCNRTILPCSLGSDFLVMSLPLFTEPGYNSCETQFLTILAKLCPKILNSGLPITVNNSLKKKKEKKGSINKNSSTEIEWCRYTFQSAHLLFMPFQ
jgi:hypothetical protein